MIKNSSLQIGDKFKVIVFGICNSNAGSEYGKPCTLWYPRENYEYTVEMIYNEGIYYSDKLNCGTIKTECGMFLWNEPTNFEKI